MNKYLAATLITIVWIIYAAFICLFTSFLISSPTKCMNYNLVVKTIEYITCENNICISYNGSNISYDEQWLTCQTTKEYNNVTDDNIKKIIDTIINTNDTVCYYNYLMPCDTMIYKKIPLFLPILLMIIFTFGINVLGWMRSMNVLFPTHKYIKSTDSIP